MYFLQGGEASSTWLVFLRGRRELSSLGIQYQFSGTWRQPLLSKPLSPFGNHQLLVVTAAFPEALAPSEPAIEWTHSHTGYSAVSTTQSWNSNKLVQLPPHTTANLFRGLLGRSSGKAHLASPLSWALKPSPKWDTWVRRCGCSQGALRFRDKGQNTGPYSFCPTIFHVFPVPWSNVQSSITEGSVLQL